MGRERSNVRPPRRVGRQIAIPGVTTPGIARGDESPISPFTCYRHIIEKNVEKNEITSWRRYHDETCCTLLAALLLGSVVLAARGEDDVLNGANDHSARVQRNIPIVACRIERVVPHQVSNVPHPRIQVMTNWPTANAIRAPWMGSLSTNSWWMGSLLPARVRPLAIRDPAKRRPRSAYRASCLTRLTKIRRRRL